MTDAARVRAREWIHDHPVLPLCDELAPLLDAFATEQTAALREYVVHKGTCARASWRFHPFESQCDCGLTALLADPEGQRAWEEWQTLRNDAANCLGWCFQTLDPKEPLASTVRGLIARLR